MDVEGDLVYQRLCKNTEVSDDFLDDVLFSVYLLQDTLRLEAFPFDSVEVFSSVYTANELGAKYNTTELASEALWDKLVDASWVSKKRIELLDATTKDARIKKGAQIRKLAAKREERERAAAEKAAKAATEKGALEQTALIKESSTSGQVVSPRVGGIGGISLAENANNMRTEDSRPRTRAEDQIGTASIMTSPNNRASENVMLNILSECDAKRIEALKNRIKNK